MVWCQTSGNSLIIIKGQVVTVTVQCTFSVVMHFKPEARENYSTKSISIREQSYSTDVEEFSESGGTDPSDSNGISNNDSDGNEELGVQPNLYEPETNTEGNANIMVLFYEITERVESKF